jgi:hypothetical protein
MITTGVKRRWTIVREHMSFFRKSLCSVISIAACAVIKTSYAQVADDQIAQRLAIVNQLVTDLKGDQENGLILDKYLASSGKFTDTTVKEMAHTWTSGLKESLSRFNREEIQVYNYPTHPEMVRRVRSIDSQDPSQSKFVALRFALETKRLNFSVVLDDLYVIASKDETFKSYVLFDNQNKMISFCGLLVGDKVTMFEF